MGGALLALAVGACGSSANVGDCFDAKTHVDDCSSSSATAKFVSDQGGSIAIACLDIGADPQGRVKVGKGTFCAESK